MTLTLILTGFGTKSPARGQIRNGKASGTQPDWDVVEIRRFLQARAQAGKANVGDGDSENVQPGKGVRVHHSRRHGRYFCPLSYGFHNQAWVSRICENAEEHSLVKMRTVVHNRDEGQTKVDLLRFHFSAK